MAEREAGIRVSIISDIRDHYGFPQMPLAAINGYFDNSGACSHKIEVGFCGLQSFAVEHASRLGAVIAREKGKKQIIALVADPGVAQHGFIIEFENGTKVITPGNPKGIAASQIMHEAEEEGNRVKRVVMLDHADLTGLSRKAKYKHAGRLSQAWGCIRTLQEFLQLELTLASWEKTCLKLKLRKFRCSQKNFENLQERN